MSVIEIVLVLATLLCALTAGFVFAFATVVMPGISKLSDPSFVRAFQVIDGVIQAGQPLFGLVWIGSAVLLVIAATLSGLQLQGTERALIIAAAVVYALGVHLPTFSVNIPLNNALQALDVDSADKGALQSARRNFEGRWNRWNNIRTVVACAVSLVLMVVLIRL